MRWWAAGFAKHDDSDMNLLIACRQTARRTFRIQNLRPEQESAMLAVLNGRDALVSLPTGFGKSLIYQVPAMIVERPTIVISPLIALMTDQEHALKKRGVPVVALHSRLRAAERRAALEQLKKGGRLVVLTTPETLESTATAPLFDRARPALLCIDEAHCISEWGHDFRPSYLRLGTARKRLGNPPVLALTATATPRVREDIAERLGLDNPRVLVAPAHRENLGLTVDIVPGAAKFPAAARRIKRLQRPGIIYCATTTAVDEVSGALGRACIPVTRYHGKMRAADRDAAQRQFMNPSRRLIMVATTAFGMGIDKPNIRYILHYQAPGSLEQYVQEIGRAGRDGRPAQCILLFDPADLEIHEHLQAQSRPSVRHLERLEAALAAWTGEERAPTAETLAYSAGVPARICEVLLSDLEEAGSVEREQDGSVAIVVPPEMFKTGVRNLVAKLKTFRYEGERRLRLIADYAHSEECRSVFIRRYFGEEYPPRCGTCDRCRADRVVAEHATPAPLSRPKSGPRAQDPRRPRGENAPRRRRQRARS
jgi:ATP-dependent DNA helicase RecQ